MHPVTQGTVLYGFGGTLLTPGTVTGTGLEYSQYYEPYATAVFNLGALTAGTAIGYVQGGTALASGYTTLGSVTAAGAAAGTQTYSVDLDPRTMTYRYIRCFATVTGGTVDISASIIAKPRTVTE